MKHKEAPFCALAHATRPAFHGAFATGPRQNSPIMSPIDGTPAATTKCNRWPPHDLRPASPTTPKQNTKNPERQSIMSPRIDYPIDKMRFRWHRNSAFKPRDESRAGRPKWRLSTHPSMETNRLAPCQTEQAPVRSERSAHRACGSTRRAACRAGPTVRGEWTCGEPERGGIRSPKFREPVGSSKESIGSHSAARLRSSRWQRQLGPATWQDVAK